MAQVEEVEDEYCAGVSWKASREDKQGKERVRNGNPHGGDMGKAGREVDEDWIRERGEEHVRKETDNERCRGAKGGSREGIDRREKGEGGGYEEGEHIAGERETRPARDGAHSVQDASCLSLAYTTGRHPSASKKRMATDYLIRGVTNPVEPATAGANNFYCRRFVSTPEAGELVVEKGCRQGGCWKCGDAGRKGSPAERSTANVTSVEEGIFSRMGGYPTTRRPIDYRREIDRDTPDAAIDEWFEASKITIGSKAFGTDIAEARRLLYTWKDLFASDVDVMPPTDLIEHSIPTWHNAISVRAKMPLHTLRETKWMEENLPKMVASGIIDYTVSPWSHRTKFTPKKNGDLRMVHVFCPINATIAIR